MKKICIYDVDSLSGGEVGLYKLLSEKNFSVKRETSQIYDEEGKLVGMVLDGKNLSIDGNLELHVFDNPFLETLLDVSLVR